MSINSSNNFLLAGIARGHAAATEEAAVLGVLAEVSDAVVEAAVGVPLPASAAEVGSAVASAAAGAAALVPGPSLRLNPS